MSGMVKDEYELPPHRFRELKHFCLQYPAWKEEYDKLSGIKIEPGDVTSRTACKRKDLEYAMKLIEMTAVDLGDRGKSVLLYATTGEIAGDPDMIKTMARKFYWILDKRKGI